MLVASKWRGVQPNWQNDYRQWLEAYRRHTGRQLAYVLLDIDWPNARWPQSVQQMASFLRSQHLKLGVIYNAFAPTTMTNDEYLDTAHQNFLHIERDLHVVPDIALFASWVTFSARRDFRWLATWAGFSRE